MNILGIGTDIVDIQRIEKAINKNTKFKSRVFNSKDIKHCETKKKPFPCFAKRFAAKEAFSKSLGTGISKGLNFNEILVLNKSSGAPYLKIIGDSLKVVNKILKSKKYNIYLTLSDENYLALATVIISK